MVMHRQVLLYKQEAKFIADLSVNFSSQVLFKCVFKRRALLDSTVPYSMKKNKQ